MRSRFPDRVTAYFAVQRILAPGTGVCLRSAFEEIYGRPEGRILDLGCGPWLNSPLPAGKLVGVDLDPAYLRSYRHGASNSALVKPAAPEDLPRAAAMASVTKLPFADAAFDEARATCVFHHLDRPALISTAREMARVVKPGGRLLVFDIVLPERFYLNPPGYVLAKLDRGSHARTASHLREALEEACGPGWEYRSLKTSFNRQDAISAVLRR